ncbi:hypothetical protein MKW92_026462, partial [Papaver armeniacum]
VLMQGKGKGNLEVFQQLQKLGRLFHVSTPWKGSKNVQEIAGGLLFLRRWNNLQFATSAAFLMIVYGSTPTILLLLAKIFSCLTTNELHNSMLCCTKCHIAP